MADYSSDSDSDCGDSYPRQFGEFRAPRPESDTTHVFEGFYPDDGLPWMDGYHSLTVPRYLTAADPRAPTPAGFKGELYAPQATVLAAMLALEARPALWVGKPARLMQTRMARLSEKFSFGKTVAALALVCSSPIPSMRPEMLSHLTYPVRGEEAININRARICPHAHLEPIGFLPEVSVHYSRCLPLTVVVAAATVISQWEQNNQKFTDRRVFTIENVHRLQEFKKMYRAGNLPYDLIFVKAGRVTSSFTLEGEAPPYPGQKNRSLLHALSMVLEGVSVARLIIDDFDTLKLSWDDFFLPALFTWLISATRRVTSYKAPPLSAGATVADFFRGNAHHTYGVPFAAHDDVLNNAFSLRCSPAYVDEHINSMRVEYTRYYIKGGNAGRLLNGLGVSNEVLEMVNADAASTAAAALGIDAKTIEEVVGKVLGKHLNKVRSAYRILARLAEVREALSKMPKHAGSKDSELIAELRAAVKADDAEQIASCMENIGGPSAALTASLKSLEELADSHIEEFGRPLERMRDNIREGCCQYCMVPFENDSAASTPEDSALWRAGVPAPSAPEAAYVLIGCCQIIVGESCIVAHGRFLERCPNCAKPINPATGLIRVGGELDIMEALKDATLCTAEASADPVAQIVQGKLRAVGELVRGEPVTCLRTTRDLPPIQGLLSGRRNAPWPAALPGKFLIFTMYPESTNHISQHLVQLGVRHVVLKGTRAQKDEAVRAHAADVPVMLVTSANDCAGLDLPHLSHIVFYHQVVDRNVEAQLAARGQRLGRQHNLHVISLYSEAEAGAETVPLT